MIPNIFKIIKWSVEKKISSSNFIKERISVINSWSLQETFHF